MLFTILVVILLIQGFFFLLAARRKTDIFTDISYGGTFVLLAIWLYFWKSSFTRLQGLIAFSVVLWGVRLASYLFLRILYMKKDRRFDGIREDKRSFAKFWGLQAVTIFLVMLAASILLLDTGPHRFHIFVIIGFAVFIVGRYIETKADRQKFNYKKQYPDRHVDVGLRSKSRHPNYFGEILVRRGIFLMAASQFSGWQWIGLISPLFIMWLLLAVSGIPPLEKQHDKKYGEDPEYQKWKKQTNLLIPV